MAHDAIESGVNDVLVFLHLNRAGEVGVLAQYLGIQRISRKEDSSTQP